MTTIEVTEDDIRDGFPRSPGDCPINRSVRRRLKPWCQVYVFAHQVEIKYAGRWYYASLPTRAQVFMGTVDSKEPATPTSFELEIPAQCLLIEPPVTA